MLRRLIKTVTLSIKMKKAKGVLLFHVKMRFQRISKQFLHHSIEDRLQRYIRDTVSFNGIMYHQIKEKIAIQKLKPYFKKIIQTIKFSITVQSSIDRIL